MDRLNFAAIDIGSNAVRLLIKGIYPGESVEEPPFDDLVPDMQVDNFGVIEIAVENGLISGYTETKFYPAESFTRGEAVATVSRVLTLLGRN